MSRSVRGPDYGLRVFDKHPAADAYRVGAGYTGYAILAVDKRLSDGELAAEFWRQQRLYESTARRSFKYADRPDLVADREREWERLITVERFAKSPSFDE